MAEFAEGGAIVDPIVQLREAIQNVDLYYYFVGDDSHEYAFCYITKELGDLLINKYPNMINQGGIRIESIKYFDLSQTDLNEDPITFEELWDKYLKYEDEIWDKDYETFEDFKKGEGFE